MFVYSEIPVNAAGEEDGVILSLVQDDKLGYIWLTTGHDFMSLQIQPDKTLKQLKFQTGLLPVNHMLVEVLKGRGCLWVSAFDRPSFIVHLMDNMTKDYALPALADRVNRSPAVMALCDDGDGMMWMMQERTGLVLYDLTAAVLEAVHRAVRPRLEQQRRICRDVDGGPRHAHAAQLLCGQVFAERDGIDAAVDDLRRMAAVLYSGVEQLVAR